MEKMMRGSKVLQGMTILVVEDEYYLASELQSVLQAAGATVLGPCPDAAAALKILDVTSPSAVLLDVNLGHGADFSVARFLVNRSTPFVFVTGYDPEVIPPEFAKNPTLQKPLNMPEVVDTFTKMASD